MATENLELTLINGSDGVSPNPINENFEKIDPLGKCYLIDAGTSGNWRWKKYSDGSAECDMRVSVSVTTDRASGSGWRSSDLSYNFPFAFSETPAVTCNPESAGNTLWASLRSSEPTKMTMFYMSFDKVSHTGSCNIHVSGWVA